MKATGNEEATTRQTKEANIVVTSAPKSPVLKKRCTPSETPKMLSSTPISTFKIAILATMKKKNVTTICLPMRNAWKFCPVNISLKFLYATR
mmetsp:Transcript_2819/g.4870  ORF Transcript_2819/g.4870 Transcript_2819/m.4870 type:complete len:92 (-) Transcript_2819:2064-2339(-)